MGHYSKVTYDNGISVRMSKSEREKYHSSKAKKGKRGQIKNGKRKRFLKVKKYEKIQLPKVKNDQRISVQMLNMSKVFSV